jgi:hypothetical protein
MPLVIEVKEKVQRILTNNFGSVRIDSDGDFIATYNSAVVFISVESGFGDDGVFVQFRCPLVTDIDLSNDVFKWVATEGQLRRFGQCRVILSSKNPNQGSIWNEYCLIADDLDESELMGALRAIQFASESWDTEIQSKFGGELFGED